jgi:hypothetical protein
MNKMVVIFKNNQIDIIAKTASLDILKRYYKVIIVINKPLNSCNRKIVMEYFNNHPEKILQYYL